MWVIPLSHDYHKVATEVDVLLTDAYESLCRGHPIHEVHCCAYKSALLSIPLHQLGQLNKLSCAKCVSHAIVIKYRSFNSPFGLYNPIVHTVDSPMAFY